VQDEQRQLFLNTLELHRRMVTDMTKLLSQLRLEVMAGTDAVEDVLYSAGGDEDMTDEQKKLFKK
jgi:hypothetical protein